MEPNKQRRTPIPARGPRLMLLAIGYGALVFFWLSPEDAQVWPVTVLGAGAATWIVLLAVVNHLAGRAISRRAVVLGSVALGGFAGALTGPVTATLMLLKTALHSHLYSDYPLPVIGGTLARAPAWGLAGALLGLGMALTWVATRR